MVEETRDISPIAPLKGLSIFNVGGLLIAKLSPLLMISIVCIPPLIIRSSLFQLWIKVPSLRIPTTLFAGVDSCKVSTAFSNTLGIFLNNLASLISILLSSKKVSLGLIL